MNTVLSVLVVILLLVGLVGAAYWLDRGRRGKSNLFTGRPSRTTRVSAILLGLFFSALFIAELLWLDRIHIVFPLLAVAALAYGLGAYSLLRKLQGDAGTEPIDEQSNDSAGRL